MNVIGIDFGCRENKIGFFEQSQLQLFINEFGNYSTPSFICFQSDGDHFFGKQAQLMASKFPKDTIFDTKRMLGRKYSDITKEEKERWPFTIKDGGNDNIVIITESFGEHDPIEVTGLIIKDLLQIASDFEKETDNVVITIPGYFDEAQTNAMKIAATKYAGIKNLTLVNESIAAAIWYSFWLSQFKNIEDNRDIIMLDIGAETFNYCGLVIDQTSQIIDISIKRINADFNIGGVFFDDEIFNYVLPQFEDQTTLTEKIKRMILKSCEEAKIKLSSSEKSQVSCEIDDQVKNVPITREIFKGIILQIFKESTIVPKLRSLIGKANENNQEFDLLMIGSSAYSPVIQDVLSDLIGKKIQKPTNPEEFIVKGACLIAAKTYLSSQLIEWKNSAQKNGDSQKYKTFAYIEKIPKDLRIKKNNDIQNNEGNYGDISAPHQIKNPPPHPHQHQHQQPIQKQQQKQLLNAQYQMSPNDDNLQIFTENQNAQRQPSTTNQKQTYNQVQATNNYGQKAQQSSNTQKSRSFNESHQQSPKGSQKQKKIKTYTIKEDHDSSPSTESLIQPQNETNENNSDKPCCCCLLI